MSKFKKVAQGVYERSGTLYLEFSFNRTRFSEKFRSSSAPNIKAAERKLATILCEIDERRFDYRSYKLHFPDGKKVTPFGVTASTNDTIGDRLDTWLEGHKPFITDATIKSYTAQIKNHLKPELGEIPLKALTTRHVKKLVASLAAKPLSKKSIAEALIPLRQMYDDAVSNNEIISNPVQGFQLKNLKTETAKKESEDIDPFTEEEIRRILKAMKGQVKNMYTLAFCSALRVSELIALKWDDIDWSTNKIKVQRAKVLRKIKVPKTAGSVREIEILPLALEALKDQRTHTQLKPHGFIFENPNTGEPFVSDKSPRETFWRAALLSAKVRYRYPYQCKHTFISTAVAHHKPLTWVARQAGHTTIQMIVRHYAKYLDEPKANKKPYWEIEAAKEKTA